MTMIVFIAMLYLMCFFGVRLWLSYTALSAGMNMLGMWLTFICLILYLKWEEAKYGKTKERRSKA